MQPQQDPDTWQQPVAQPTSDYHPVAPPAAPPVATESPQPPATAPIEAQPATQPVEPPTNAPSEQTVPDTTPIDNPVPAPTPDPLASPDQDGTTPSDDNPDEELIRWTAPEYANLEHSPIWYAGLGVIVVLLVLIAIFLLKSITFAILIPVMAVALVLYVRSVPTHISYILSRKGLHVNDRLQPYDSFRGFSVTTRSGHDTILLLPRKRFSLGVSIYFPPELGEAIVDLLAARLPMKDSGPDFFDKLISKLGL